MYTETANRILSVVDLTVCLLFAPAAKSSIEILWICLAFKECDSIDFAIWATEIHR